VRVREGGDKGEKKRMKLRGNTAVLMKEKTGSSPTSSPCQEKGGGGKGERRCPVQARASRPR